MCPVFFLSIMNAMGKDKKTVYQQVETALRWIVMNAHNNNAQAVKRIADGALKDLEELEVSHRRNHKPKRSDK